MAAFNRKLIILTSGTSWTVPGDWNNTRNYIHLIGGGAGGGCKGGGTGTGSYGGGGGGAYTRVSNYQATLGSSVSYVIGTGGAGGSATGGTGAAGSNGNNTTFSSGTYVANGGSAGTSGGNAGSGGTAQSISGLITLAYSGGDGVGSTNGGGGGAAGPYGAGNTGSNQNGGAGDAGYGGNGGTTSVTVGAGAEFTTGSVTAGSGGGGRGGSTGSANDGGLYGGGAGSTDTTAGGSGANGVIIIEYYTPGNTSGYTYPILNSDGSASSTIVDLDDMMVRKELFLDAGLWGWGSAGQGQLGDSTVSNKSSPVAIGLLTNWKQIADNDNSCLAVKTDGTLWGWGNNASGQLGDGTTLNKSSPIQIGSLANWKYIALDTGVFDTSFAIKTDGTLWAWGDNTKGQLGLGTSLSYYSSPIQVGSLTNWKQISVSTRTAVAIKTDGTLWAWGWNTLGTIGDGTATDKSTPVQVGTLNSWKQVSCNNSSGGNNSTCFAIKTDGTLWAWGAANSGNLGDGTIAAKSSPVQVGSLTNWKQVSKASAIKTDGTLWIWGNNASGQLGDGTTVNKSSPVQVGTLTNWKYVSATYTTVASAIKTDGTLWMWGAAGNGKLGDGTTVAKSSPVQIGSLTNWKQVSGTHAIQAPDLP